MRTRGWVALVLASAAVSSILTVLVTTRLMTSPPRALESDYLMGDAPPPTGGRRTRRTTGGDPGAGGEGWPGGGDEDRPSEAEMISEEEEEGMDGEEEEEEEVNKVNHDGNPRPKKGKPRAKRIPKGKRWNGWRQPRNDGENQNHGEGSEGDANRPPNVPINADNQWWRRSRMCFEVDHLCHGREENEWFYYEPSRQQRKSSAEQPGASFQPTMELKCAPHVYDGVRDWAEERISIRLSSSSRATPEEVDRRGCRASPTPTHVVLQSLFNDMIGEFYSRTLLRLYALITDEADGNGNNKGEKLSWEEDIQFYVHISYGNKKMLDGHKLLLSGMMSSPDSPPAQSLIDLFVKKAGADDAEGGDGSNNDCRCYEKMVFCGYDVYTHASDVQSRDLEPAAKEIDGGDAGRSLDSGDANDNKAAGDHDAKYTLWSAGKLASISDMDKGSCGKDSPSNGNQYKCRAWDGLRKFISSNFVKHYPTLERDIESRRRERLLEKGAVGEGYEGDTREFAIVGLTQRTYRRAWLNLPSIMEACNAAFSGRAICVEVNVEDAATPFEQLLMHRSLDAVIGVHGAQLTQAILLPERAHVLELLPWVPDYIRGRWVTTTHKPTPLGEIFHNTDLNHVGYSLDRSSVPLCEDAGDEQAEKTCFMARRKSFLWENRDFDVEARAVLRYVEDFVLFGREEERTCEELKERLDGGRFVLYNIWCSKPVYWFPGFSEEGRKACIRGAGYPFDHTDEFPKGTALFNRREDCCARYTMACTGETRGDDEKDPESSAGNVTVGNVTVLYHNYHTPPQHSRRNFRRPRLMR